MMNALPAGDRDKIFSYLLNQSCQNKVREQQKSRQLILDGVRDNLSVPRKYQGQMETLGQLLSPATEIFIPGAVQREIYSADTGTHMVPRLFKKWLLNVRCSFIVRPGTIEDTRIFVEWAHKNNIHYTIRGAGTWPFGGAVPINDDIILDLSYLDFKYLDPEKGVFGFSAGVIFPDARNYLKERGFALRQEITNKNSGTITGWIATGGLGLGSYKYGHISRSIISILLITPQGELKVVDYDQDDFNHYFGSEGQIGIIVGVILRVRKESYLSKPFAFSFNDPEDACEFMRILKEKEIKPTSVIYFDKSYIEETFLIENEHSEKRSSEALRRNDQIRLAEAREDYEYLQELGDYDHIIVMQFDEKDDYQKALKTRLFAASGQKIRFHQLTYLQVSTILAHKLWNHRFLPVQMKQKGPSMLVSETIIPLDAFLAYQTMIRQILQKLLNIDLKTEAHLLSTGELLLQSLILADTRTLRHKLYFALVPLMTEVAIYFGARPYGIGIWNFPFFKKWKQIAGEKFRYLSNLKSESDRHGLINRGKFINTKNQKLAFRIFSRLTPIFNHWIVNTSHKRQQGKRYVLSYPFERLVWNVSGSIFPKMVPPGLKAHKKPLAELIAPCAECDSCERVCPTSDVFGLYGLATPITRRKTALRLVEDESITKEEAAGFLICTRCDNCTHVCPTDIPLTELFDLVEKDNRFIEALAMSHQEKNEFIDRFWQVMKESPLYTEHTLAEQKDEKSHLSHGLKILYPRGFEYGKLFIDSTTCIHCGMCSDENACMYGAREGKPRQIPELLDLNCALCNACVNYCPQNKVAQEERQYMDRLIYNAPDLEEKKYWVKEQNRIHDTTKVHRSNQLTEMADRYVTEDIIMEIDKEASNGQIPVSGMGQGDRHMGIGFDAERFAHFHIVGPAQNRLHEGDPDEELSIILGKRDSYCRFDNKGSLLNEPYPTIKLMSPILYNTVSLESNGRVELALIKVAEKQKTLVAIELERLLENYNFIIKEGEYEHLPRVIIPRVDHELIHRLIVNPRTNREFLTDLWQMPVFEVEYHPNIERTLSYIRESVEAADKQAPLISGYIEISEYDLIGSLSPARKVKEKVNHLLDQGIDILHIHGMRNKDEYFVTSGAVRALHHYLMRIGRRHELSLIASGGIRLASDSQKTIQRGAEGTMIDFAALLALDPTSYKAIVEEKTTTEKLLSLDIEEAVKRLNNQAESRKVQILEVLGASGFKDIKKTVGEEGRLIDFHQLENRLQRDVFENESLIGGYEKLNGEIIAGEFIDNKYIRTYQNLKDKIKPLNSPHNFYRLGDTNQTLYKRDYVWPGSLIESLGKMASGDLSMLDFRNVKPTGLLGDGFDVMKILYNKDPMDIPDSALNEVRTALSLDKDLVLEAPWMFGGKSVGSIGLDTWRAHVIAARELGIQYDTGEGGYPTSFFLNSKGEPVFFSENVIQLIRPLFVSGEQYTIDEIRSILRTEGITEESNPEIFEQIKHYPSLKPFHFMVVVDKDDEPFVSTEMKTGLFGVTKETIRKARRVVIAYSQGAKMGIGGHILAKKVNKLVSYLRGIEGVEKINAQRIEGLFGQLNKIIKKESHPLKDIAQSGLKIIDEAQELQTVTENLKEILFEFQEAVYRLHKEKVLDDIDFENLIGLCETVINYSYSSIISPFPFHNCYSIEDVKAFIDVVHMINPGAVISVKVSPSIDIEFIATGLGRIAKDNTEEIIKTRFGDIDPEDYTDEVKEYARKFGMKIEIWLDGPRGGTGASPNIIKGQMGMHIEYAIPLIHSRLVKDGLRNHVNFLVSGGIRTYEDVIKSIALGADGIIWGTAPLVAIGCDRNRNCHDGCSRGIATSNLTMQKLRDVEKNTIQMINAFTMMQMHVIRGIAALGFKDIRELRGRFDKLHWIGLKERVDHRFRVNKEIQKEIEMDERLFVERMEHTTGQSNCGVAAINGSMPVPGYILDSALNAMRNRGMDGVGVAKSLCFPDHQNEYGYSIMVKGVLQKDIESNLSLQWQAEGRAFDEIILRKEARKLTLYLREEIMHKIKSVFLDPFFDFYAETDVQKVRDIYKLDEEGEEIDFRHFGDENTDPGDIFRFFTRVKKDVIYKYVEDTLLKYDWSHFLIHQFPNVTKENYKDQPDFLQKAEDLYVFDHSINLTRILYTSNIDAERLNKFAESRNVDIDIKNINQSEYEKLSIDLLSLLREFIREYPFEHNKHMYKTREFKIAAVMSCGKNFATWKTAGRVIPWQTPDAPNNIIHVRLATGSVVEQMNAHPFTKLHTALTHNGETTNYEALRQRVEQFGLSPLASTDTDVAALKFHLIADEWAYPDWAMFESFSPTTGDDLKLIDPDLKPKLEQIQRVEFASSPDGPYQYLCLRHDPQKKITERVDLKDPADLRPNVSAFWKDGDRVFSMIASEEQALNKILELLDKDGLIDGVMPDKVLVSSGMISRYHYDDSNKITGFEFIDRYGKEISIESMGKHHSIRRAKLVEPSDATKFIGWEKDFKVFFRKNLSVITFNDLGWLLNKLVAETDNTGAFLKNLETMTWFRDSIRTLDPGDKAQSSLIDMSQYFIDQLLDRSKEPQFTGLVQVNREGAESFNISPGDNHVIVVDAGHFLPEGSDPALSLAAFLNRAYDMGWRKYLIHRAAGQRLISTAVMGGGDTDDVVMDVYGSAGEYFGAFMQGGTIRLHGNAQNFCAMGMHHGNLYVYGNAGKVCGYASKGGKVFIMGNVVDRCWTNSVNDSRCQDLEVFILGSATKYAGESLMGGNFFFGGMHFNTRGQLCLNERPYLGTKMLGGASRGNFVFFDPKNRLMEAQYTHGKVKEFTDTEWKYYIEKIKEVFELSNIPLFKKNGSEFINVDGEMIEICRDVFKLIVPKGGLKGYESH
ncbi:MAG: glutamate synthase-related protein [Calditrichaceae bacterium]